MKKPICLILILAIVLAMFAGCRKGQAEPEASNHLSNTDPTGATGGNEGTAPEVTIPDETAPEDTDPTEPDDTAPDNTDPIEPDYTEATEPDADATDPTDPAVNQTEPINPTVPAEPPASPTEPSTPTEPPATPTEPVAPHTCSFTKSKTVAATCTEKGYTVYTCPCGATQKRDYTDATGHSYGETVVAPTCVEKGYTLHQCAKCGDSYKDTYTDTTDHSYVLTQTQEATTPMAEGYYQYDCKTCGDSYKDYFRMTEEEEQEWCRAVAAAAVKYINQFRVAQGDTEAQSLPGLTLVAEYRAVQLQTNFAHSTADLREAYAYYEYGEWVDGTLYGGTQQYYTAHAKEAIAKGGHGDIPDDYGRSFAEQIAGSAGHWAYVGSSDYPYIGIGISYGSNGLCMCILQTETNYG